MTPAAMLNLLHRGHDFLCMDKVGLLIMDECHCARKRHPYAQVIAHLNFNTNLTNVFIACS